jgi:hypothetical protein
MSLWYAFLPESHLVVWWILRFQQAAQHPPKSREFQLQMRFGVPE